MTFKINPTTLWSHCFMLVTCALTLIVSVTFNSITPSGTRIPSRAHRGCPGPLPGPGWTCPVGVVEGLTVMATVFPSDVLTQETHHIVVYRLVNSVPGLPTTISWQDMLLRTTHDVISTGTYPFWLQLGNHRHVNVLAM